MTDKRTKMIENSATPIVVSSGDEAVDMIAALEAIQAQTDKLNFDGLKLKTDATLSGTLSITEVHLTDSDTDLPVDIIADSGGKGAMFVQQSSQPLPTGAATDGAPITGESLEAGGSTILGWLSSIRKKIGSLTTAITDGTLRGTVNVTDGGGSLTVDGAVSVSNFPAIQSITGADDFYHDAFGRLRASEPGNRFDVEFSNDLQPLLMDQVIVGAATITHNATTRDVALNIVSTGATNSATFGGHYHVPYTPGCSQLIDVTGTLDYAGLGGGTASIFLRNNGAEQTWAQSAWTSKDNATSIDWKYSQILMVDFQSLKVGRLRVGFVRGGVPLLVHSIVNDNVRANGYWQRPNLPLYWRIYNSGGNTIAEMGYGDANNGIGVRYTMSANANAKMLAICGTVKSEGGPALFDLPGFPFVFGNEATTKSVGATLIPLCSIQVQTTFNSLPNRSLVIPTGFGFYLENPVHYKVLLNPTLTNANFAQIDARSCVYGDTSATAVSGGIVIDADYVGSASTKMSEYSRPITGRVPLSIGYAGTTGDILTVAAIRTTGANAATAAVIKYREVR